MRLKGWRALLIICAMGAGLGSFGGGAAAMGLRTFSENFHTEGDIDTAFSYSNEIRTVLSDLQKIGDVLSKEKLGKMQIFFSEHGQ